MSRRWRTVVAGVVCIATLSLIVGLALRADGREETRATNNDGGAWLVDRERGTATHVEYSTKQPTVQAQVAEAGSAIVALQAAGVVAVHDTTSDVVKIVDPANALETSATQLPAGSTVQVRGDGVVVNDATSARLWLVSAAELAGNEPLDEFTPALTIGVDAVTVGAEGTVAALTEAGLVWPGTTPAEQAETANLPPDFSPDHLTMAGGLVVVADGGSWLVGSPGRLDAMAVDVTDPALFQQEGASADVVGVVDRAGRALSVQLATGATTLLGENVALDNAARPILHDGCLHTLGGPSGARAWAVLCGDERSTISELQVSDRAELKLVNGEVWVDELDGSGYVVTPELELEEIADFSSAFDREDGELSPDGENVDQVFDQQDADALAADGDPRQNDGPNQPPTAEPDEAATRLGRPVVVDVLANDTDPDSDVLLVTEVTLTGGEARLEISPSGNGVQVTPIGGAQTITASYRISDGRPGGEDGSTITVQALPLTDVENRPPDAALDRVTGATGSVVSLNVLDNDEDPDGDSIVLREVLLSEHISVLSTHPGGDVYLSIPSSTTAGELELTYVVEDEWRTSSEGTIRVTTRLTDSNSAPDARNDAGLTQVGRRITLNLLANDVDPDNDLLVIGNQAQSLDPALGDLVTTTEEGEFSFVPSRPGTFLFTYSATDRSLSDEALIRIEVVAADVAEAPIAVRDDVTLALGETRLVRALENDGDLNGDLFAVVDRTDNPDLDIVEEPGVGFRVTVEPSAGDVETFQYRLSDGQLDSELATVVVARSNDVFQDAAPVVVDDIARVRAGRLSQLAVLRNDFDPEGGPLEITQATTTGDGVEVRVARDAQTLEVEVPPDTVLPFAIQYAVADEAANVSAGIVEVVIVSEDEPNTPPDARPDVAYTIEEQPVVVEVLLNDSDNESDAISLTSIPVNARNGTAELTDDGGAIRYTPDPGFRGTDTFSYLIRDSQGDDATGTVGVGVMPESRINRPPVAEDDLDYQFETGVGTVQLDVLVNDRDDDLDELFIIEVTGGAAVTPGGKSLTYDVPDQVDGDQIVGFSYTITDGRGGEDSADVRVVVAEVLEPLPPVANPDTAPVTRPGEPVVVNVLLNDEDPDGDPLALTVTTSAPGVSVVGGELRFDAPDESGEIRYTVTDVDDLSDTSFVTVPVEPNLPPVVPEINLGEFNNDDEIPEIDLTDWVDDPDGDPLTFFNVSAQEGGTTQVVSDPDARRIVFTPSATFEGEAGFSFSVEDDAGNEASGRVTLTLLGPSNEPPVAVEPATSVTIAAGGSQVVTFAGLFTDPNESDVLTYAVVSGPGSPVTITDTLAGANGPSGVQLAAPITATEAETQLVIEATDPEDESAQATVTITVVRNPAGPPQTVPDVAETNQEQPVTVDVVGNDIDTLGEGGLRVIGAFSEQGGVSFTDTEVTLTPRSDFFGDATVQYTVTDPRDNADGQAIGLLTVTVIGRPSAPANVAAVAVGPTSVALSWTPAPTNGAGLDRYEIEINGGEPMAVPPLPATVFDDLTPGTEYSFRVRGVNQAGPGVWSDFARPPNPPNAVPGPPGTPVVTALDGELDIAWTEGPNEGSAILFYELEISGCQSGRRSDIAGLNTVWTGLANGVQCSFRAYAVNAAGTSLPSSSSTLECPVGVPTAPAAPGQPLRGDTEVDISWSQPTNPDCQGLSGYEIVRYRNGAEDGRTPVPAGTLAWTSRPLANGESYAFAVRAENRAGWGPLSPVSPVVIPCGLPFAPPAPTVERGDTEVTVTRVGEAGANGCAIEQYEVSFDGGGNWDLLQPSGVVQGLTNGTSYTFQIRGVNDVGPGAASPASASVIPAGPPFPPYLCRPSPGCWSGAPTWDWAIMSTGDNGSPILRADFTGDVESSSLAYDGNGWLVNPCIASTGGDCLAQWTSNGAFQAVCLQVAQTVTAFATVSNDVDTSESDSYSFQLPGCPDAPSMAASPGDGSVQVSWSVPSFTSAIWLDVNGVRSIYSVSQSSATVSAPNGQVATIRVWACNNLGCRSSSAQTVTPQAPEAFVTLSVLPSSQFPQGFVTVRADPTIASTSYGTYSSSVRVVCWVIGANVNQWFPGINNVYWYRLPRDWGHGNGSDSTRYITDSAMNTNAIPDTRVPAC